MQTYYQAVTYQMVLQGDSLRLSGGDLPQPVTFGRQGGGQPSSIVGSWVYTQGNITMGFEIEASGQGSFNGVALTWSYAAGTLTLDDFTIDLPGSLEFFDTTAAVLSAADREGVTPVAAAEARALDRLSQVGSLSRIRTFSGRGRGGRRFR